VFIGACCSESRDCVSDQTTFEDFFQLTERCGNEHWDPQSERFPDRVWQTIDFVGHMETLSGDAHRLLKRVGAWDGYADSGWGPDGTHAMFADAMTMTGRRQSTASQHATGSRDRLRKYYTARLEKAVERRFQRDYEHPVFRLRKTKIFDA